MPTLTQLGNGAIKGATDTTLTGSDLDKSASGDVVIVYDKSATQLKRVLASGLGGGSFLGDGSGGTSDIIRVHEEQLDTSVTVAANTNGLAAGPLIIADGVTLTVSGNLSVV